MRTKKPACLVDDSRLWCRRRRNNTAIIGMTDLAQRNFGEIDSVDLPLAGTEIVRGEAFGVIETSARAGHLVSPVNGRIINRNNYLSARPRTVNQDPHGEGWMLHVQLGDDECQAQPDGSSDISAPSRPQPGS